MVGRVLLKRGAPSALRCLLEGKWVGKRSLKSPAHSEAELESGTDKGTDRRSAAVNLSKC